VATVRYSINVGDTVESITVAAGAATVSKFIELTIDTATTRITDKGSTRAIKKGEVLIALDNLKQKILADSANLNQ